MLEPVDDDGQVRRILVESCRIGQAAEVLRSWSAFASASVSCSSEAWA
ncbi:MAG: hypothetical protein ACREOV_12280 [Candidatus Dormibacteraceae bacterium]